MDHEKILAELQTETSEEYLYRTYHKKKHQSEEETAAFLQSLDIRSLVRQLIVFPELKETMPSYFRDDDFLSQGNCGILIRRHHRLKPAFPHRHSYYETLYVLSGTVEHTIDGQSHLLCAGDLFALAPGAEHSLFVNRDGLLIMFRCKADLAHSLFANSFLCPQNTISSFFGGQELPKKHFLLFHTGADETLRELTLKLYEESNCKKTGYEPVVHCLFMLFWANVARCHMGNLESSAFVPFHDALALEILTYIQKNPADVTLKSLSQKLNYTTEYTSRIVPQLTGLSFSRLRTQARMSRSAELLNTTRLSVSEISAQCGYQNPESFIRAFQKEYAITPAQFRRTNAGGTDVEQVK